VERRSKRAGHEAKAAQRAENARRGLKKTKFVALAARSTIFREDRDFSFL
jgi:hypothetical protein